jgi:hypothetical protein
VATGRIGTTPVLTTRWSKAPAAGTTSLSGLDDNSVSLVYSVGYEAVYQNGVLLSRGNDYTATNGTTITLTTATVAGDIIEVFANQTIPLADTYSQTVANGKFINNTLTTTTGDIIYASAANTPARLGIGSTDQVLKVSGGIPAWGAAPSPTYVGALAYFFSSQNLTSGVAVVLTFTNEGWDTNSFHDNSTNTSRMTIPSGYGGKYLVQIVANVTTGTDTSIRLLKNGANISNRGLSSSQLQQHVNTGGNTLQHSASFVIDVAAADYLEAALVANAASKVCTDASFSITYLGA